MKIGVFGDSFANRNDTHAWWNYLSSEHGHHVRCFGEAGSSLSFSVDLLEVNHQDFDHVIWCATSTNRISFWHRDRAYHHTGTVGPTVTGDPILDAKRDITHRYLTMAFEPHFHEIQGRALIDWCLVRYPNLTIIPCFAMPVYFMRAPGFNLFELCEKEVQAAFPGSDMAKIVNSKVDQRQGHLTTPNHQTLARLLASDLRTGIFQASYDDFVLDQSLRDRFTTEVQS